MRSPLRAHTCAMLGCVIVGTLLAGWGGRISTQNGAMPDIGPGPTFGIAPPDGAVVLFDGTSLDGWKHGNGDPARWPVADGAMTVQSGSIVSDAMFGDAYIHIEFCVPDMPQASGQSKGNSGVILHGRYEVQVLDSYGKPTPGTGDCAAVYGQHAALLNACRPPLEWQTFDIVFRTARYSDDGELTELPRLTLLQNGIVVQNNVTIQGSTRRRPEPAPGNQGPLLLQDHGCPVRYRNIWLVKLPEKGSETYM